MKLSEKNKKNLKILAKILFLVYIFILCFTIARTTKFDSAPDEKMKYDVCQYIFKNGKLPRGYDESIRNEIWGISYAFTPILSYVISAVFMKITSFFTQNEYAILVSARLVSVLCITGYAAMCIKIADKLFKGCYKILFVALVTMLPQLIYLGTYINNDSLALFAASIIVYGWILGLKENWSWKSSIITAIGIGICALSYYNAYGYLLSSILIYFGSCIVKRINVKEMLKKGITIALIAIAIAGWWFVRSYILYDGDFLAFNVQKKYSEMYAQEPYKPSNRPTPANQKIKLSYMLWNMKWIEITVQSLIGLFGYMNVEMNARIYLLYKCIFIMGILGIIIKLIQYITNTIQNKNVLPTRQSEKIKNKEKILFNITMLITLIIPIVLSIYYSYFSDFQAQGRYIMPLIIPLIYFVVEGYQTLINDKVKNLFTGVLVTIALIMPTVIANMYIINKL